MDWLKYIVCSEDESPHCLNNQEKTKVLTAN